MHWGRDDDPPAVSTVRPRRLRAVPVDRLAGDPRRPRRRTGGPAMSTDPRPSRSTRAYDRPDRGDAVPAPADAYACGALGCTRTDDLRRVERDDGRQRVLCPLEALSGGVDVTLARRDRRAHRQTWDVTLVCGLRQPTKGQEPTHPPLAGSGTAGREQQAGCYSLLLSRSSKTFATRPATRPSVATVGPWRAQPSRPPARRLPRYPCFDSLHHHDRRTNRSLTTVDRPDLEGGR